VGAEESHIDPLVSCLIDLRSALEDENPPAVGSTQQKVVVSRVAQRGDVVVCCRSNFLCLEVFSVEQRFVIDVKDEEILVVG
jgi:hypothetical protein